MSIVSYACVLVHYIIDPYNYVRFLLVSTRTTSHYLQFKVDIYCSARATKNLLHARNNHKSTNQNDIEIKQNGCHDVVT